MMGDGFQSGDLVSFDVYDDEIPGRVARPAVYVTPFDPAPLVAAQSWLTSIPSDELDDARHYVGRALEGIRLLHWVLDETGMKVIQQYAHSMVLVRRVDAGDDGGLGDGGTAVVSNGHGIRSASEVPEDLE